MWSGEVYSKPGVWGDGGSNIVWYVIQVMHGEERRTMELIKVLIDRPLIQDIFLPEIEVMKRYYGEWHKERALMFPGYIFIVTETIYELSLALGQVPKLTKALGTDAMPVALEENEVLLQKILNPGHVAEISQGMLEGKRLTIKSDPMEGLGAMVKRIDRHKRTVVLEVEMFGWLVELKMGMKVVRVLSAVFN